MSRFNGALIATCLALVFSAPARAGDRLWFGGGISADFGDVDYINVAPTVGYSVNEKLSFGAGLTYGYRKDGRIPGAPGTDDYGGHVFGRYRLGSTLFAQAELEHLSYEFVRGDLSTDRDTFSSVLAGPGFVQPIGRRTSFFGLALYNFSYDENDLYSPYDSEWVYRVGVNVGF